MIPKSNAHLKPGDFCFIKRDDNRFALFIWLCPQGNSRSYFYGALATTTVAEPSINQLPNQLEIGDHVLMHIKAFRENETPIMGNLADRLGSELFEQVESSVSNMSVGAVHKVWGHRTIIKYANSIPV